MFVYSGVVPYPGKLAKPSYQMALKKTIGIKNQGCSDAVPVVPQSNVVRMRINLINLIPGNAVDPATLKASQSRRKRTEKKQRCMQKNRST
jgi:hypothetical protein